MTQSAFIQMQPTVKEPTPPRSEQPMGRIKRMGPASVSTAETIAAILGQKNTITANRVMEKCNGLYGILRTDYAELAKIDGMNVPKALKLQAALELGRRVMAETPEERYQIRSPSDAANLLMPRIGSMQQECFLVMLLDTRNRVIEIQELYKGSLNTSLVRTAEVFKKAIIRNAAGIVVSHNHPSGDPNPSPEDIKLTRHLVEAGKLMEIDVLDHLIIGQNRYVSLRDRGLGFDTA